MRPDATPLPATIMKLHINGAERIFSDLPAVFTLAVLVERLGIKADRVAVELNRAIVRKPDWESAMIGEGAKVEVVWFVGGG